MQAKSVSSLKVCLCLALLYLSWGGSFLGIKLVLTSFPPVFQGGIRLCCAGLLLLLILPFTDHGRISGWKELFHYWNMAFFIMFLNNVFQAFGQQSVSSGVAAMLYGIIPLAMVLGGWLILGDEKPSRIQGVGIAGAMVGMALLSFGGDSGTQTGDSVSGVLLLLAGVLCFVVGSLYSRYFLRSSRLSLYGSVAVVMVFGGIQSLAASWLLGERVEFSSVTPEAWGSMIFLTLFTSILGYGCYYWLLAHTRTIVAVSFAYIDPVIAVALGALFADEPLTLRVVLACALIVAAVMCGFSRPGRKKSSGRSSRSEPQKVRLKTGTVGGPCGASRINHL